MRSAQAACIAGIVMVVAAVAAPATSVRAQEWPAKPVRIVVPYGAGGAADTLARLFGEALSAVFGKQFVVENRPGGGGLVGSEAVAKSPADGYTFGISGMAPHVLAPAMNRNAGFDPMRDFTHVAYFGGAPNAFFVHPSHGAKTFKEFMASARTAKEGTQYVSPGIGSTGNLVAEYLAAKENIKLTHVFYKGGAAALVDLIAGHVKVGMMSWSTAREHARSGKLIALAVSSSVRMKDFPDLPTLKELGYPDLVATTWWSLSAPAGLPAEIAQRVNREVNKALDTPQVRKQLEQEDVEARPMSPSEVTQFMRSEVEKWAPVARNLSAPK